MSLSEKRQREKRKKKNKLPAKQSEADELAVPDSGQVDLLVAYYQRQELDKAGQLAVQLSETFPRHPVAWRVLSALAHQEGRIADSLVFQERVIDLSPSDAEAHFNMGILLKALNKREEALASYRTAVSLQADYPDALNNMGALLLDLNKLEEAEQALERAISLQPDDHLAHNNWGLLLAKQQKFDLAIKSYERSIALNPDFFDAKSNLGLALTEIARFDDAIIALAEAVAMQPDNDLAYINFGNVLKNVAFVGPKPELYTPIIALLQKGKSMRPMEIAIAVASLLQHDPVIQNLLSNDQDLSDRQTLLQCIKSLAQVPLLSQFMRINSLPDIDIERVLAALRRAVLGNISELASEPSLEHFLSSLALHCFINEYVYVESDDEALLVSSLEQNLQDTAARGQRPSANELLCLATYIPLSSLQWIRAADIEHLPHDVRNTLIDEPLMERSIASSIPCLAAISQETSLKVKQQYEESPYPRWTRAYIAPRKASPDEIFRTMGLSLPKDFSRETKPLQILVAGCGTGQQSIEAAFRYRDAEIFAVDLSLASLAYASRKSQELGIDNVNYLNGDILDIDQIGMYFDIIECSGVLHHMEDPMAGWRSLTDLLKPGGLMRVGLYSEFARQDIVKVRDEIATQKIRSSPSNIRNFRQSLFSSAAPHHINLRKFTDFYSLSEFRDLIFHVQEHRFTALQIRDSLNALQLCFLGFEEKAIRAQMRAHLGDERDHLDLAAWHELEQIAPATFNGMYQFWCQKPESADYKL